MAWTVELVLVGGGEDNKKKPNQPTDQSMKRSLIVSFWLVSVLEGNLTKIIAKFQELVPGGSRYKYGRVPYQTPSIITRSKPTVPVIKVTK